VSELTFIEGSKFEPGDVVIDRIGMLIIARTKCLHLLPSHKSVTMTRYVVFSRHGSSVEVFDDKSSFLTIRVNHTQGRVCYNRSRCKHLRDRRQ